MTITAALLALAATAGSFAAEGTSSLEVHGRLADSGGAPLSGVFQLRFSLTDPFAGKEIWTETRSVKASAGVYSTLLGTSFPLPPRPFSSGYLFKAEPPRNSGWVADRLEIVLPASEPLLSKPVAPEDKTPPATYQVQDGDTLRSIAEKLYGDPKRWAGLYEANRDKTGRGGDVEAGQMLVVPK